MISESNPRLVFEAGKKAARIFISLDYPEVMKPWSFRFFVNGARDKNVPHDFDIETRRLRAEIVMADGDRLLICARELDRLRGDSIVEGKESFARFCRMD